MLAQEGGIFPKLTYGAEENLGARLLEGVLDCPFNDGLIQYVHLCAE